MLPVAAGFQTPEEIARFAELLDDAAEADPRLLPLGRPLGPALQRSRREAESPLVVGPRSVLAQTRTARHGQPILESAALRGDARGLHVTIRPEAPEVSTLLTLRG